MHKRENRRRFQYTMAIKQQPLEDEPYRVAWIILTAAKHVQVGKHKLAEFLKGSRAKDIEALKDKDGYGGLLWYTIPTIAKCVDQLEKMNYLCRKTIAHFPYDYTALELSDAGRKALEEKQPIPIKIIVEQKPIIVGDSEKETYRLFKQGKTIAEIMRERNLVRSTIYTHFYRLIVCGYMTSSEMIQEDVRQKVEEATKKLADPTVKQLKEILPEISYEEIRCVLGGMQREQQEQKKKEENHSEEGVTASSCKDF